MSDYLGNLLERSFAPTLELRPRMPSLFEPPPATALSSGGGESGQAGETVTAAVSPPDRAATQPTLAIRSEPPESVAHETSLREAPRTRGTTTPADHQHPNAPIRIAASVARDVTPTTHSEEFLPTTRSLPAGPAAAVFRDESSPASRLRPFTGDGEVGPSAIPPLEATLRPQIPPDTHAQSPPRSSATVAVPDELIGPHASARTHHSVRADPDAARLVPPIDATPRSVKPSGREQDFRPVPKSVQPLLAAVAPAGLALRPSAPVHEAALRPATVAGRREARPPSSLAESSPAPSIHVTIGRIEVRATPAPARARAKREPEMSLETYLQRRAEGGRR